MATPARINQLAAVNIMLTMIGQAPVNTVAGAVPPIVAIAKNLLDEATREVLSEGWSFNREWDVTFRPDTSDGNRIAIPDDVIQADSRDVALAYTFRDGYLFNKDGNTFEFTEDVVLDVLRWVDFDGMPEPVKQYIAVKAGRTLQRRVNGNMQLDTSLMQDEMQARVRFLQWEADQTDPNLKNTDVGFAVLGHRRNFMGYR